MSAFGSARFINLVYERSEEKMSKQIYLDNAATTQMSDAVKQAMEPYLQENYGNASTAYSIGEDARRELEKLEGSHCGNPCMQKPQRFILHQAVRSLITGQ